MNELGSSHVESTRTPGENLNWYVLRTTPRHEKRVFERLEFHNIECFLPFEISKKRWKNGVTAVIEAPLFPTYLFVRVGKDQRFKVLNTTGANSLIGAAGNPWVVPSEEIDILKAGLPRTQYTRHAPLTKGDRVRIVTGPLAGLVGTVLRDSGPLRVVLTVSVIWQGVAVEVSTNDIEPELSLN